jgi:hypothetical protein
MCPAPKPGGLLSALVVFHLPDYNPKSSGYNKKTYGRNNLCGHINLRTT